MSKLSSIISKILNPAARSLTTTQMRMGSETGQVQGLRFVKNIPFFGSKPFKEQYRILLYLLVPTALATVGAVVFSGIESSYASQRIERSTQLQMLSQRTALLASQLSNGEASAAPFLAESIAQVNNNLDALQNGASGLSATSGDALTKLNKVVSNWKVDEPRTKRLLSSADTLLEVKTQNNFFADAATASLSLLEKIRVVQLDANAPVAVTSLTAALTVSLLQIQQLTQLLDTAVLIPEEAAPTLAEASRVSSQTLDLLLVGNATMGIDATSDLSARERIEAVRTLSNIINANNANFVRLLSSVRDAKAAAFELETSAANTLKDIRTLTDEFTAGQELVRLLNILALSLALLSLLIGFFWIWLKLQETRLTTAQVEESIMHLMTDLISISDGNLALRARVAENMTGSIADSLNLTVARLNRTMTDVKEASQSVRKGSEQMTTDAAVILEAVRDQSGKIKDASSSVNSIADSVQAIAFAAEQSSDVARQQQEATQQGRDAVIAVITSMDSIREQIQDTSKRIKRLGESAQEIDEIIELISDTTEQTNVLAMNASIQAAAAGEAGRGFRAVATEVQRLAERSDQSLKRIVALIRSMQADTQNAVSAMERSTQEVVAGAQTTNKAGQALNRIEEVSSELNSLISAITEATQQQTEEAKNITERMSEILQISTNTARGVEETTSGIQTISTLAEQLDDSMGQFKLQ